MNGLPADRAPWSDEPLSRSDIEGRDRFASVIATRINAAPVGQPSTVFGIVGPWGSGKTTILRDVENKLTDWEIVWFTPWSASSPDDLIAEFMAALGGAFTQDDVKSKIALYANLMKPMLRIVPLVGEAAGEILEGFQESRRPAWHTSFREISDQIGTASKRVLVVVDDVDRLDNIELRALLKVVRLLGRFANVHYLLAYDQSTIEASLGLSSAHGEGAEYMEKIVQHPFEVPSAPMIVRRRWAAEIIDLASQFDEAPTDAEASAISRLTRILATGLETPRSAGRLREQMVSIRGLASQAEVDLLDFTALTWLRIAHHRVWDFIRLNRRTFFAWKDPGARTSQVELESKLTELVVSGHHAPVINVIDFLFGAENRLATDRSRLLGRMRNARYFERYFHIGLSESDISDRSLSTALDDMLGGSTETEDVKMLELALNGSDTERTLLALDLLLERRGKATETSRALVEFARNAVNRIDLTNDSRGKMRASASQWFGSEIFAAVVSGRFAVEELVSWLGYQNLALGVDGSKSDMLGSESAAMDRFNEVFAHWIAEMAEEPLSETLGRSELLSFAAAGLALDGLVLKDGFLRQKARDAEDLIEVATLCVSISRAAGRAGVYEARFEEPLFLFMVGNESREFEVLKYPDMERFEPYNPVNLSTPNLTDDQYRHFAMTALHRLWISR